MLLNSQIITCIIYNLAIIGSKSKAAFEELHSLKYLLTKKIIRIWMCHFQTVQKIQLKESWAFSFLHGQISLLHFHLFWHFHPLSFNQTLQGTNINFKWSLLAHSLRPQQLIFKPWRDPVGASHCLLPYRREFFHWLSLEKLPGSQRSYWRSWWLRTSLAAQINQTHILPLKSQRWPGGVGTFLGCHWHGRHEFCFSNKAFFLLKQHSLNTLFNTLYIRCT